MDTSTSADLSAILEKAQALAEANQHGPLLVELALLPTVAPPRAEVARARLLSLRARANYILGHWDQAEADARAVMKTLSDQEDRAPMVGALHTLGELQQDRGDYLEAVESQESAAHLAVDLGDDVGAAESNLALAALHSKTGNLMEAESRLNQAFGHLDRAADSVRARRARAAATVQRGIEGFRKGGLQETIAFCKQALQLLEGDGQAMESGEAYRFMGIAASSGMQHKEALRHHLQALTLYKRFGFQFGMARIYSSIGQSFLEMGKTDEAIHFMEKAERLCKQLGAMSEAATLYGKLGRAFLQKEEFETAADYFRRDLQLSQKSGKRAVAYIQRNLALSLAQAGDTDEALGHFRQSLQLFQQLHDEINTGKLYQDMCQVYLRRGDFERARSVAPLGIGIFAKLQHDFEIAYMNALLGMICRGEQDYAAAERHFKEALEFLQRQEITPRLADAMFEYGLLQLDTGKTERALECFSRAMRMAQRLGLRTQAQRCYQKIEQVDEVFLVQSLL